MYQYHDYYHVKTNFSFLSTCWYRKNDIKINYREKKYIVHNNYIKIYNFCKNILWNFKKIAKKGKLPKSLNFGEYLDFKI